MKTIINDEKCNSTNEFWFIVGSIALFTMACVVIPKVNPRIAGYVNKQYTKCKNARKKYDEFGPTLVKKDIY